MSDEVQLSMSLPLDGDGFLRRECPTCEREFKWLPSPDQLEKGNGTETELEQLASDPLIAPARVLTCESQHQLAQVAVCRRTAGFALLVGPFPTDQLAMPTQQRRWSYQESVSAPLREQSSKRSDERTTGGPKPRTLVLTSQNRELVPQQHQLHILGELGSPTTNEQAQKSSKGTVSEGEEHRAILPGPANPSELDGPCAVQRFLVFARARETSS
jgi:hypothetical protein